MLTFFFARTIPCLLWPLSLLIWRKQIVRIPMVSRVVYHCLGVVFGFVNYILWVRFFSRYISEDFFKLGIQTKQEMWLRVGITAEMATQRGYSDDASDVTEPTSSVSVINDKLDQPCNSLSSGQRMVNDTELMKHDVESDAWVALNGYVYDVTKFLQQHPGGSRVLLRAAGSDCSKAFTQVGHSQHAYQLLEQFRIGSYISDSGEDRIHSALPTSDVESHLMDDPTSKRYKDLPSVDSDSLLEIPSSGNYGFFKQYPTNSGTYFPAALFLMTILVFMPFGNKQLPILTSGRTLTLYPISVDSVAIHGLCISFSIFISSLIVDHRSSVVRTDTVKLNALCGLIREGFALLKSIILTPRSHFIALLFCIAILSELSLLTVASAQVALTATRM